ncbi:MAG: hypothetical protein DYG89_43635 [Caldilinea sp. CFX5]|nr:hypothetical protein [Caldilinea sp. CFX5]
MLPPNLLLQDRYQIVRKVAQGGMGAVYEAIDQRLGHPVALKQIVRGDPAVFAQEAQLLARLRHPALPKVSDYFSDEVGQFLVMDFIPGEDLATLFLRRKAALTPATVLDWGDQLLATLDYLHKQTPPVIHRDIKPANLKLTAEGQLVLLDFGLAKGKTGETDEEQKSVVGYTLAYAPPEQMRGQGTDARSDLYSAAATLYHLLVGSTPPDAGQRALAVSAQRPDPLTVWHPPTLALPTGLLAVLYKAMALTPAERFADAEAFRTALRLASQPSAPIPHNLPTQLTPLIGRAAEIATLQQWLTQEETRLITLTGVGGSGKTRLALAVAQTFGAGATDCASTADAPFFADGIFFINLAAVRDADLVLATIAQTLGVKEAGIPVREAIQSYLHDKRLLLVVDNFEQVIAAAPLVSELLTVSPLVKMLVTSRETLRLRGEREFVVPMLTAEAAVALFVQRAQAVKPAFTLEAGMAAIIAEICQQIDYLPLAIELAAARSKLLPPPVILERLHDRFTLLRGGARDLPVRQQTLEATIDWSYNLLSPDEQALYRRLAVFVGGCTLEAAAHICLPEQQGGLAAIELDPLDGLTSLVDKHLLEQQAGPDGEPRFAMLLTIQAYAMTQLVNAGEWMPMQQRHADYYLVMAEEAERSFNRHGQGLWFERLESEHNNFRAILAWAQRERTADALALRLSSALWYFWETYGHISEGRHWLADVLRRTQGLTIAARIKALRGAVSLALDQSDFAQGRQWGEEGLALARQLDDQVGIANAFNGLGRTALYQGDFPQAHAYFAESLAYWQRLGDDEGLARALNNLASAAGAFAKYDEALHYYEQGLALFKKLGDQVRAAYTLGNMGLLAQYQKNYSQATTLHQQSLELHQALNDRWGIGHAYLGLGHCAFHQHELAQARTFYKASLTIQQELGDRYEAANVIHALAYVDLAEDKLAQAATLFSAAAQLRQTIGASLIPVDEQNYQQALTTLQSKLVPTLFTPAWAAGQTMSLNEAINYASTAN